MTLPSQSTWWIEDDLFDALVADGDLFRKRSFGPGQMVYEQGDIDSRFYIVMDGLVRLSMFRSDGTEVILELMGPRTLCGEGPALDGLPRFASGLAVEPSLLLEFDAARMDQIAARHPRFAAALLRVTALKQRVLANRLEQFSSRDPETRILEMFERLGKVFKHRHAEGGLPVPRLTHDQIAAMTGNTRVTVTRALGRLRERGAISIVDGQIVLMSWGEDD